MVISSVQVKSILMPLEPPFLVCLPTKDKSIQPNPLVQKILFYPESWNFFQVPVNGPQGFEQSSQKKALYHELHSWSCSFTLTLFFS